MNRVGFVTGVIFLAALLCSGLVPSADMPARNIYWAKVEAIEAAVKTFPVSEIAAFKSELQKAVAAGGKATSGHDLSFKNVSESDFFGAFLHLIKPHVERSEIKVVKDLLKAVSDGKWIQGRLVARNGGDFTTTLELVTGQDGKYVFRQRNNAVNSGAWKGTTLDRPLGVGPPSTRPR